MTLVSQIIIDAHRQSNLIAIGAAPTTAQQEEGLRYLSRIVKSTIGNEVGEDLNPFPLGRADIQRPSGWPWYGDYPPAEWFIPENTRLMANVSEPGSVYLHPTPDDGARFGIIDVAGNFSTNPVTIVGNGRNIDGAKTVTLNIDKTNQEWLYRADLGGWMRLTPLLYDDVFPFPEDFDFYFITMLCMALNPAYGVQMDAQTQATFRRAKSQINARYHNNIPTPSELGLLRMSRTPGRRLFQDQYGWRNSTAIFKSGNPF